MSKKYKYKYSELYCFEPEPCFPVWVSFVGKDANNIKEIRIYDTLGRGDVFLPEGFVREIREVVNRWVSKYPCFRGLEEEEENA